MTTITVDIDEIKSEKALIALKAVIEAFDLITTLIYSEDIKEPTNYEPEFVARIEKQKGF